MFPGPPAAALGTGEAPTSTSPAIAGRVSGRATALAGVRRRDPGDVAGEVVGHDGLVRVDRASLWTIPADPPPLVATAVSVETAAVGGRVADGLITMNGPLDTARVVGACRGTAEGQGGAFQVHFVGPDRRGGTGDRARQWRPMASAGR